MHAVGFGRERDVDAVVDQQRNAVAAPARRAGRAPPRSCARVEPCLSRSCTSVALAAMRPREIGKRAAAGDLPDRQGHKAEIDAHQLTFARAMSVALIEIVQRIDDRDGEAARPCRLARRQFAGDAR